MDWMPVEDVKLQWLQEQDQDERNLECGEDTVWIKILFVDEWKGI